MMIGCVSLYLAEKVEPGTIIIRNACGKELVVVTLISADEKRPKRFGAVSPVLKGASTIFGRPSNPPALPDTIMVKWEDISGKRYERKVALKKLLRESKGNQGEQLVFTIFSGGRVGVSIENN